METEGIGVFGDVEADRLIVVKCDDKTADNLKYTGVSLFLWQRTLYVAYICHYIRGSTSFLPREASSKLNTGQSLHNKLGKNM